MLYSIILDALSGILASVYLDLASATFASTLFFLVNRRGKPHLDPRENESQRERERGREKERKRAKERERQREKERDRERLGV